MSTRRPLSRSFSPEGRARGAAGSRALALTRAWGRDALREALRVEWAEGMPQPTLDGQLIRPLAAYAAWSGMRDDAMHHRFWCGTLAVQLAHEASLLHDDVVDGAGRRRGEPTVAARAGVGRAVVEGDHLLTTAYRMAAATGSLDFVSLFARSVERTVAGELAQGHAAGERIEMELYQRLVMGKSGELLGCALAVGPTLLGVPDAMEYHALGMRLGLLYQMLDDLLDYCPAADTGKAPLRDYVQQRWTWPLLELAHLPFGRDASEVLRALHARSSEPGGESPLRRCLARLEREFDSFAQRLEEMLPSDVILRSLLQEWRERAGAVVAREEAMRQGTSGGPIPLLINSRIAERVPRPSEWVGYMAAHSRSFRFATRFFPREPGEKVARVYAYCRVTDDLVDRPGAENPDSRLGILDEWVDLSRTAYEGRATGLDLLDRTMGEMAAAAVPFTYAAELVEGMRMDVRGESYASLARLQRYTYRVAGVVGLWIVELFGVHNPRVLAHAARMGHAMQLTNILRDVGEDWRSGRLYLPLDRMRTHGVSTAELEGMCSGQREITRGYRALLEELLLVAEQEYRIAFTSIPRLPRFLQQPVAVAARVYGGIHDRLRENGYDNFARRAHTSAGAKLVLAGRGLWQLRQTRQFVARIEALEQALAVSPAVPSGSHQRTTPGIASL